MTGTASRVVSRCDNYREDLDTPCTGSLWAAPGDQQARCDTCGGWCGIAVLPDFWPPATSRHTADCLPGECDPLCRVPAAASHTADCLPGECDPLCRTCPPATTPERCEQAGCPQPASGSMAYCHPHLEQKRAALGPPFVLTTGPTGTATRVDGPTTINLSCPICSDTETYPNKGMGRAHAAAWMTRHQHQEMR